jgi:signal transduction histidine kinase
MAAELAARDEALRTSDRLRRQMLADVSHELRTPLTTMLGFLDTLHMPQVPLDGATRARYLATIERETRRLDRLVRDLLDLARLENGVGSLQARLFDIRKLFEHVAERHAQQAQARGIAVRIDVEDGADQVSADPDRIEQVIENLFANAIRHTPDGGAIELKATAADGAVLLAVADSGPGIPAEHQPHIFERFYKTDAARTGGTGGSGLGLSISRAIVERHRGSMEVASRPGHTVFTVRLPDQTTSSLELPSPS